MRVQATVIEAALHSRWSAVVEALQFAGTPRESAGWWFFAAGMAQFFRYMLRIFDLSWRRLGGV